MSRKVSYSEEGAHKQQVSGKTTETSHALKDMSWNKGVEISAAAMFSTSSSSGNDTHFWAIELVFAGLPAEKTPFTTSFWLWQIGFQGLFLNQSSERRGKQLLAFARSKSFKPREKIWEAHLHYATSGIVWSKETYTRLAYKYTHMSV